MSSNALTMNVLGRREWHQAKACQRCGSAFTLMHRAHHCRKCGDAVCAACSSHTIPISGHQQRVCDTCFTSFSLSMYKQGEEEARKTAAAQQQAVAAGGGAADAAQLKLEPPPKRQTRKPLKLAIPASLSYLQTKPVIDVEAESQSFSSPLSPEFASSSRTSAASPSSQSARSQPGSAGSSPSATPTHGSLSSTSSSSSSLMQEAMQVPNVPSVAAMTSSPTFQAFKSKLTAFHASIQASESEWEKRQEKRLRAERPAVRDRLALVTSIIASMKKEKQRRDAYTAEEEERLAYFTKLRAEYVHHLDQLELDLHFPDPTSRRYKLRINAAEERITIAAEDLALERVSGAIRASVGAGRLQLELSDVVASIIIFGLELKGKGTRVWGHLMKPERVTAQVTVKRVLIPLSYQPGKGEQEAGKWVVDAAAAVFDIHVVKSVKGAASVPDSLVAWIINTYIPKAALAAFDGLIPGEVGQLFSGSDYHVLLQGGFDIHCSFSNSVWEADLSGNSADSDAARSLVIPTDSQLALAPGGHEVVQARMHLLNNLIIAAKLQRAIPSVSLNHFAAYIRHFSCCVDQAAQGVWLQLLTQWQLTLNELEGSQSLWFFNFIERIAAVDDKPLELHFALKQVSAGIGVVHAVSWSLDAAMREVQRQVEEEKKRRLHGGKSDILKRLHDHHSLLVPSGASVSSSAPSSPHTASSRSPSSRASSIGDELADDEEAPAVKDSISNFLASTEEDKGPAGPQSKQDGSGAAEAAAKRLLARPRSSSSPGVESPRNALSHTDSQHSIRVDRPEEEEAAEAGKAAAAAREQQEREAAELLTRENLEQILRGAEELKQTALTSLATGLDIVKSLSLTVAGALAGGPVQQDPQETEDAQVTVSVSRFDTELTMPPLKLTIGAMDWIKSTVTTTPALKIVTRCNPLNGCLDTLTQLTDPSTGRRYTYHFSFKAAVLSLFPLLLQHQQQLLFSSSLTAVPAVSFKLDEMRLEGPLKPALEWEKYLRMEGHENVVRAHGSAQEKQAAVKQQDDEEKMKAGLRALMNPKTGPDVAAILLPYLLSVDHQMRCVVKLQITIHNTDAGPSSAADAYRTAATNPVTAASLPPLAVSDDAAGSGTSVSGNSGSGGSRPTSISLLASSSSFGIAVDELQDKLRQYRNVIVSVRTPSISRLRAMDDQMESKMPEQAAAAGAAPDAGDAAAEQQRGPKEIVLEHGDTAVIEGEQICVDVSFKATLSQLIADVMQLSLG